MKRPAWMLFFGLCFISALFTSGNAQPKLSYVDSLKQQLKTARDENRVDILNKLSDMYSRQEIKQPIAQAKEALKLAQKLDYPLGQAYASYNLGHHLISQGSYSQALDYLFVALKIYETTRVDKKRALVLRAIGHVYSEWKAYQKGIEYYQKQLNIGKELKDTATISSAYINMSYTFLRSQKPNKAIQLIDEALKYSNPLSDTLSQILAKANRAKAFFQLRRFKESQQLFFETYHWCKLHGYRDYEQYACVDIAQLYLTTNQLDSALTYANKGYIIAKGLKSKPKIKDISEILYQVYKKLGNTSSALHYLEQVQIYQDSILTDQKQNELASQELLHRLEKSEGENKKLKEYRDTSERGKVRQQIVSVSALLVLLFALVAGYLLYRNNRFNKERSQLVAKNRVDILLQNKELKRQHHAIEEKNDQLKAQHLHIFNSIRSAQTIQQAILPQDSLLRDLLFDYFVIFRPRDIVSGDFYWLSSIGSQFQTTSENTQGSKNLLAVVDSTGHGVPGAFMSMIGNTLLDRIVKIERITSPAEILTRLNLEIFLALQQNSNNNDEGMEIGLCSFEKMPDSQTRVIFSGARRPFCVVKKGLSLVDKKIEVYKGSRRYIGGQRNIGAEFANHEVILNRGDAVYMFSDGFADQNGDDRKKLGSERLVNILLENAHWPMVKQEQLLTEVLENHQGTNEQRDDILLMGVRIT